MRTTRTATAFRLVSVAQATRTTISSTSNRLASTTGPIPAKTNLYDAAGNLQGDGSIVYTYSDRGRLSAVANGSVTASYLYNGIGQRISKTGALAQSGANVYAYDEQGKLLGEYQATGISQQETVYLADMPVVVLKPDAVSPEGATQIYFVYADHINTPRVITSAATGGAVWRWDSADPFGVVQPNENPAAQGTFVYNARFPGQLFDKETNTHYNFFRDYDPQLGRYVQSDVVGLNGGVNTYAYVQGNPLGYSDPFGLWSVELGGFYGFGISVNFGVDAATGRGFSIWQLGYGLGGGVSYDKNGGLPPGMPNDDPCKPNAYYGVVAKAGVTLPGVAVDVVTAAAGRGAISNKNYAGIDWLSPSFGTKWGIKAEVSGGIQLTQVDRSKKGAECACK